MSRTVKVKVIPYIVCDGGRVGGKGLVEVLEAIRETGSIRLAAEKLGINYRRVWARIKRAERLLGVKLVETGRGGSRLTGEAERIILVFKLAEEKLEEAGLLEGLDTGLSCG